ncbi:hypothetical protein Tsubulata_041576 [Turnera subulata]|uniref:S-protein homolog n=1 Tax=Turnera subulata TaxID=218843 RepID=A0A9Q0IWJ1_9ROSI|nr:hypothetical protein Tsubulata_041576 [Turnera subulata]
MRGEQDLIVHHKLEDGDPSLNGPWTAPRSWSGQDLFVHCKSADDDLGLKQLRLSESFMFTFHPMGGLIGNTLFFCKFTWASGSGWFDIYYQKRDQRMCDDHRYIWEVKQSGPCLHICAGSPPDFCYPWNPNLEEIIGQDW